MTPNPLKLLCALKSTSKHNILLLGHDFCQLNQLGHFGQSDQYMVNIGMR